MLGAKAPTMMLTNFSGGDTMSGTAVMTDTNSGNHARRRGELRNSCSSNAYYCRREDIF